MKKTLLLSATLLLVTFFSQNSYATWVPGGTTDGEASAHIIQPLEISKVADLKFGNIAAGPSAGTVVIATDDARTKSGGATLIAAGNVSNAASFDIIGYPDATFTIDIPETIQILSGTDEMTVDNFVSDLGSSSALDGDGMANLKVGATLNVEANQAPGLYTGSFDVTVAYN